MGYTLQSYQILLNIPLTSLDKSLSHSSEAQLPPLKPARTTAAVILMPQWYHLRHTHHIVAKLHVNGKANCTLAQRHQKDNSICPTSSGKLKPIQATKQVINSFTFLSGFRTSNRITEVDYYVSRNQMSLSLSAASNSSSGYSSAINLCNRTESALNEHTQASLT